MKTLDRQKDFGTITGDTDGRCYVQGDTYFDFQDREIKPAVVKAEPKTEVKTDAKTDVKTPEVKTDPKVEDQLGKQ